MKLSARAALLVFFLIVFLAPVILGPFLDLALAPFGIPFHRVMSRALLISALAAVLLFRDRLKLRAWWRLGPSAWIQVRLGLGLAIFSGTLMILLYGIFCGFRPAGIGAGQAAVGILTAIVASLVVPMLEETIFRGFLVTTLVEAMGRRGGWLLGAAIFAVAHFLRVPAEKAGAPVHFWSGATGMISFFTYLGEGDFLAGRGLNLFLVGLILGGIFLRFGTLWVNAALHGGWILILMIFTLLTRPLDPPRVSWLGRDILSSPLTSCVLLALGLWLWRFHRGTSGAPEGKSRT